jgi:hypothetical protein
MHAGRRVFLLGAVETLNANPVTTNSLRLVRLGLAIPTLLPWKSSSEHHEIIERLIGTSLDVKAQSWLCYLTSPVHGARKREQTMRL